MPSRSASHPSNAIGFLTAGFSPVALPCVMNLRPYLDADRSALWRFMSPVFRAGDTYACQSDIDEAQARANWVGSAMGC